ncbi:MAG: Na/Pi cotransporter family protein [Desulfocapsa sp.]|uniref:Na/Pi cotransporter family protein n=1 Tax=Desulfotalea psychrophila TaxID=84980 RepID=A0ABS3AT28_9BACT|nr:Na/Pi cotransporter family protein [Desulfocapsa sp.]MBN4058644.1 Na/Pi cotransporter family protein [Desulfocapsa sp. AH-315-J15]MBN4067923.1 Na/Pi cotransporter family protein [Desulfotalea psychrophila]
MSNPLISLELWGGLFGGLALFLFGMDIMTKALKLTAGDHMKDLLARFTRNRFVGAGMGAIITSIVQSSSVTTVLLVGFISAGIMSMSQSIPVIIGANIGTTVTAQILAFKVTKLALILIAVGFFLSLIAKKGYWRQYGLMILGLGLVFYGMSVMSEGMKPLRSYEPFISFMITLKSPLIAVIIGAVFTAVIQSSSATAGIMIVMAGQGLIGLEPAIALILGSNIGTCVTAGLASIGKPREAVRTAVVHTLFNITGALLWVAFIPQLADIARWISPVHNELNGLARLAAESPRQIANVHTVFNMVNACIFIGFTTQMARLVEWLVPDKPIRVDEDLLPKYLDESLLTTPSIALEATSREIARMGAFTRNMVAESMPLALTGNKLEVKKITAKDKIIDSLYYHIIEYLRMISSSDLSSSQSKRLVNLIQTANGLERIGDIIATDLVVSSTKRINENVIASEQTVKVLMSFHNEVVKALDSVLKAVSNGDKKLAKNVKSIKDDVARMNKEITRHKILRLTADAPNRISTYAREVEVVDIFDNIFRIVRRISRLQAPPKKNSSKNDSTEVTE